MNHQKRMKNVVNSSPSVREAYHVAFRETKAKLARRKAAKASRKRNRG